MHQIKNEAKKAPIRTNRIMEIIDSLGFQDIKPTDQLLHNLGISRKRFFQILKNQHEMQVGESEAFFIWLNSLGGVETELDLFAHPVTAESVKSQFKMTGNG